MKGHNGCKVINHRLGRDDENSEKRFVCNALKSDRSWKTRSDILQGQALFRGVIQLTNKKVKRQTY